MFATGVEGLIQGSDVPHVSVSPSQLNGVASDNKQVVPSPVSPNVLQCMLHGYGNVKTKYLVNGFTVWFNIGCLGIPVQTDIKVLNMKSAFQFPQVIDDTLLQCIMQQLQMPYLVKSAPSIVCMAKVDFESASGSSKTHRCGVLLEKEILHGLC